MREGSFCGHGVTCRTDAGGYYHETRYTKNGIDYMHTGQDFTSRDPITSKKLNDAKVYAGVHGTVTRVARHNGFGDNTVIIDTLDHRMLYGHMEKALVTVLQVVTPTTAIGIMGNQGGTFPVHLHVQAVESGGDIFKGPFVAPTQEGIR